MIGGFAAVLGLSAALALLLVLPVAGTAVQLVAGRRPGTA